MINILDEMDEIFGLVIALDRQVVQGNYMQAYVLAKKLSVKLARMTDELYLEVSDKLEPVRGDSQ